MPTELVRYLVVELIPAEALAPVLAGEGPKRFPLAGSLEEEYADWELVSHTLQRPGRRQCSPGGHIRAKSTAGEVGDAEGRCKDGGVRRLRNAPFLGGRG
jgi:hypothetical protein